jgi:hypothetical protein
VSLYGILPGDWSSQTPLEIASTPITMSQSGAAGFLAATVRGRVPERKALPARAGGQAATAPGVRRVAVE